MNDGATGPSCQEVNSHYRDHDGVCIHCGGKNQSRSMKHDPYHLPLLTMNEAAEMHGSQLHAAIARDSTSGLNLDPGVRLVVRNAMVRALADAYARGYADGAETPTTDHTYTEACHRRGCLGWVSGASDFCSYECERASR